MAIPKERVHGFIGKMLAGFLTCFLATLSTHTTAQTPLRGTPIGTAIGYSYESASKVMDIQGNAFDGDLNTYFATYDRSYTWVGLDLGTPHVISCVGWSPRNDGLGPKRVQLGVIQGANSPDFLDALPIYLITETGEIGKMSYADVNCTKGFRYVRFVSTGDSRCNIAELEFYGSPGAGDDSRLFQVTNLPTVVVNTVDAEEPYDKEHDITANIMIIDGNKLDTDKPGTIRERGNASRLFPKKPWRLKFDKKQNILDAPAKAKKWTLINNYGDKTLMRNMVAFEIARLLEMPFVPWCRPVDVILNGEYKGCYQLCDQVEVNPGRLNITEMEETDITGEALTGGYFFEIDTYAPEEPEGTWFRSNRRIPITIKSPDDGGVKEQFEYIRNYFNTLEAKVFSDNRETDGDYRDILDINSFINHFIVGELSGNTDTYWSTYMYKERLDRKVYTGPVWDFDIAFDNDYRTYPINDNFRDSYIYDSDMTAAADGMRDFVNRIIKNDPRTISDISRIWSVARNSKGLTPEHMAEFIATTAVLLDQSQKLNFTRWDILGKYVHMNPHALGSYSKEVEALSTYLENRIDNLDRVMGYDSSMTGIVSPVEPIISPRIDDGRISFDGNTIFSVFTIDGRKVYHGTSTSPRLNDGIYIIRTSLSSFKIKI